VPSSTLSTRSPGGAAGEGVIAGQLAFQAGPISASLPAISTTDPLLSIVVGVVVFDETFRHRPVALVALVTLLAVLVTGGPARRDRHVLPGGSLRSAAPRGDRGCRGGGPHHR
jgi:hypothetical protein